MDDAGASRAARLNSVSLTIVVPAYNEAGNVEPVVDEILQALGRNPWVGSYELLLVDDGSRDGTGAVMDRLAARHSEVVVAHHETNRGFGAALRTGFARSRGDAVGFITADGEVSADEVLGFLRDLGDNDLVLSRRARTVGVDRRILTWGFDLMVRLILGFWIDKTVGIYLVRGDVVRSMTLFSDTGLANLEVILTCRARGCRIVTTGIMQARPRLSGVSKVANLPTVARTLWEMLKLRWRIVRGRTPEQAG